ncbi:MAG: PEP-CTERM sorting domain-containing protein, partial [Oxalobacteraceae bacterium]
GVRQSIATVVGATYLLDFYLGNVTGGHGNAFGTQSSVGVEFSSGGTDFSCTNTAAGTTLIWQLCSQRFVAATTSTVFTLRNLDSTSDFSNAVDDVSFTRVMTGVPEPTTWAMLVVGFGAIGGALRRKRQLAMTTNL